MTNSPFSRREAGFLSRVAVHMAAGADMNAAMQRVRDDDARLLAALRDPRTGPAIKAGLAAHVYHAIRGQRAMERAVNEAKEER